MTHLDYQSSINKDRTGGFRPRQAGPIQLAIATLLLAQMPAVHAQAPAEGVETVIVTGTRGAGARVRDSAAPITVISAETLQETGAANLFDAMTALVPSYNAQA